MRHGHHAPMHTCPWYPWRTLGATLQPYTDMDASSLSTDMQKWACSFHAPCSVLLLTCMAPPTPAPVPPPASRLSSSALCCVCMQPHTLRKQHTTGSYVGKQPMLHMQARTAGALGLDVHITQVACTGSRQMGRSLHALAMAPPAAPGPCLLMELTCTTGCQQCSPGTAPGPQSPGCL